MSSGIDDASTTKLNGSNNPYWRLGLSHEWGPHNIVVGTSGILAIGILSRTAAHRPAIHPARTLLRGLVFCHGVREQRS